MKKDSWTTAGQLFLLNTLYSLRRPQPQNVAIDLCYSLMINYKYFRSNEIEFVNLTSPPTAQKMKFTIKDSLSKYEQTAGNCGFGHIY